MRRRAMRRSLSSCDSPGSARPDAAAEALEVLPHAPHARQVVLELRELDLQLALGADGVLGEDVEDQLGAVDDTRVERASSSARCCVGSSSSSTSSTSAPRSRVRRASAPRACPCRRTCVGSGRVAVLHELGDRLDAARCARARAAPRARRRRPPPSGAPRARARARARAARRAIGSAGDARVCRYARAVAASRDGSRHGRSSSSTSRPRACTRTRSARTCARSCLTRSRPSTRPRSVRLRAASGAGVPLVLLAGHYDTVPAQGNMPGPDRGRRRPRSRRDRHEGWRCRGGRARARAGRAEPGPVDVALLFFGAGGAAGAVQPAARALRALAAGRRGRRSRSCSSRPTARFRPAASAT